MWVLVWKLLLGEQILQSAGCSHPRSLDTSGKVKLKGSSNKGRDLLPLCVTQLCSFLKSSKFLSHKQWELLPILR